MHDKSFWTSILENKGEIPENAALDDLTDELLDYLRLTDPQLRDEFAFQILAHWILSGHYDADKLGTFLERWLADLQVGLGETGTDSVLTRSFAALMLSILVYYDIQKPWISDEDYGRLVDAVLDYFIKEQDLRGYDSKKGWLHATAHTADVLKFLARNEKSDVEILQRLLDTISAKLSTPQKHMYSYGEDERLALVVLDVVKRALIAEDDYADWLKKLVAIKDAFKPSLALDEEGFGALQNVTHFLRALHITLAKNRKELEAAAQLEYQVFEVLLAL